MADLSTLYPRNVAARHLELSPQRVDQLAEAGKLPYVKTALGRLFDPADVERLAQERAGRQPRQHRRPA